MCRGSPICTFLPLGEGHHREHLARESRSSARSRPDMTPGSLLMGGVYFFTSALMADAARDHDSDLRDSA